MATIRHDATTVAEGIRLLKEIRATFTLTATHCTCCGKSLRDAESVNCGIGPDCRAKLLDVEVEVTNDMVASAVGFLATSGLASKIKLAVASLRDKPRDLCNVLVWWAAVHLDETAIVLECAEIVSLLGFVALGDRIRERTTNVVITRLPEGGDFVLRCLSKTNTVRNMRRVREAVKVAREGRFKFGWRFPDSRKDLVWAILGEDFGGQWATVPGVNGGPSRVVKVAVTTFWNIQKMFEATYNPPAPVKHTVVTPAAPAPVQTGIVRVTSTGVEVHTPRMNAPFMAALKMLPYQERRWDPAAKCWRVAPQHEKVVRELVEAHFS